MERLGALILAIHVIGLLAAMIYFVEESVELERTLVYSLYAVTTLLLVYFIFRNKGISPILYDTKGIYYIYKGDVIHESWENIYPIQGESHNYRRALKIEFINRSAIGKKLKGVYFTPKAKLITPYDIDNIIRLSNSRYEKGKTHLPLN